MFSLNESLNYYLYPRYISMGKGVDCLCELIRQDMKANPLSGDVYLFFSKNKGTVKILRWDKDLFCIINGWKLVLSSFPVSSRTEAYIVLNGKRFS